MNARTLHSVLTKSRLLSQTPALKFVSSTRARVAHRVHMLVERALDSFEKTRLRHAAQLLERNLTIIDVGCRAGIADAWETLGAHATVVGFDPDADECERLRANYRGPCDVKFVPAALGATTGESPLFITQDPACSSVLEPDASLADAMPELSCIRPLRQTSVRITTLDRSGPEAGIDYVDFMKIDTQGSELMVLQGASNYLATTRALEIEVEFNPLYVGQPLFGDVDAFLRERGFVLWRLKDMAHYSVPHRHRRGEIGVRDRQLFDSRPVRIRGGEGQLYWCNAYYVKKDLAAFSDYTDWQAALRDACLNTVLRFPDLASFGFGQALQLAPRAVVDRLAAFSDT